METKCNSCGSCGMPFERVEDHALGNINNSYCVHCADNKGKLLPYDIVLKSNIEFYVESQGIDKQAATQMAKEILSTMPAWKHRSTF